MGPVGGQLAPQRDAGAPQRSEAQAELGDAQPEDPDQDPNCANQAFGVINKFQGGSNITETSMVSIEKKPAIIILPDDATAGGGRGHLIAPISRV